MSPASASAKTIDMTFTAPITKEANSGWTCVIVPGSGDYFGTRRPVKVAGVIDRHPFQTTLLPIGDGTHMLPLKAALRKAIGKVSGEHLTVHLQRRLS